MKAKIKLAFRIVIDRNSTLAWDRYIFEDTYFEYKIQHQVFDDPENPVKNYWELLAKNPNSEKIPFLLSTAVVNYVSQLNGEIKSLPDVLGSTFFPIEHFRLDLISSNVEDPSKHKLGLTFYTPELLLIDIIDNKYLLSRNLSGETFETYMFGFHPQVAIAYYVPV
ncbi:MULTISPECIES: hypothetical protein [Chryseobacterium]|uniref:Uncharacterized protein n=1 Tax=Chryseobacterium camelliae TaxID=1265445 RepID=A0ABU0TCR9_9FLAO|nr:MULTISPECIES: hypothetical protein [Chryseobacterium]MDT3407340.1 hypothetical protein [Pseudacidovorax intermedius]MDQ1094871.1 hypothetical protein [Chryseobacterium camelliae]MDQ1098811.1 hypothetical protein [Chryseobacterium sp. SORGH_AS_1048]MDR6086162.1 hypothetical protein [Chryseobacterium sp. SORGH_AS_0909]MDR6130532.1 hypothetical protein [Chryseobacterium sp. SORGH_AS_1175]